MPGSSVWASNSRGLHALHQKNQVLGLREAFPSLSLPLCPPFQYCENDDDCGDNDQSRKKR